MSDIFNPDAKGGLKLSQRATVRLTTKLQLQRGRYPVEITTGSD